MQKKPIMIFNNPGETLKLCLTETTTKIEENKLINIFI